MNDALLDAINGAAGRTAWLDALGRFAANDLLYLVAALAVVIGLLTLRRDPRGGITVALAAAFALALAMLFITVMGHTIYEQRPFVADLDTRLIMSHAIDNSFPSDHATGAAALATVAAISWRRWSVVFVLAALCVGVARVFVGVHYPLDVVEGWLLGALAGAIGCRVAPVVMRRTGARFISGTGSA